MMVAFKSQIKTHVSLLKQISNYVNTKYNELMLDTKDIKLRYKRGLFNGIGTIWKTITGNLDASDGQYFNECIDKINRNEGNIEKLMKKQISVTTSVIKSFNSTLQKLKIDEETFNRDLVELGTSITNFSNQVDYFRIQIKTLDLCESLMESYTFIKDTLNDAINAVTFARLKILHGSIIKSSDLEDSLRQISNSLQRNHLPLPVSASTIAQYIDLIELDAYQSDTKIVFVLKIPLVDPSPYILYRLYPIPILDNRTGLYHTISTVNKYIARDDDSLFFITFQDINNCKSIDKSTKICSNVLPYPIDSDAICEAQLLRQQTKLPKTCRPSIFYANGYHVQSTHPNSWLITTSGPIPITVKCEGMDIVTHIVEFNSVVSLGPTCNAFIGSTRIQAKPPPNRSSKESSFSSNPAPVLIPYTCCEQLPEKHRLPKLKPLRINELDVEDLNMAEHSLNQYSEQLEQLINQPFIEKHMNWFTVTTIVLVILLITLYILCKCRKFSTPRISISTGNTDNNDFPVFSPKPVKSLRERFSRFVPRRRPSIRLGEDVEETQPNVSRSTAC